MSDLHLLEDEATLYVLGRLTEAERNDFEARLAQSAELRALVRELEEGGVAVAMAAPRRRVPPQLWERIEKAVTEETRPHVVNFSCWFVWLRNGWAAAAACLVGWLVYALWVDRTGPPDIAPAPLTSEVHVQPGEMTRDSARREPDRETRQPRNVTNKGPRIPEATLLTVTRENDALHLQNEEFARQLMHLSQVVTQQQTLLSEPSRLKFFQLVPASDGAVGAPATPPAPDVQRALFLAMARELGWSRPASTASDEKPSAPVEGGHRLQNSPSSSTQTNQPAVDFVDLQPTTNEPAKPLNSQPQPELASDAGTESSSLALKSASSIPGFVSGTNAIMIVSPWAASAGSYLTFWSGTASQGAAFWSGTASQGGQALGTTVLQNNPLVVRIPLANLSPDGLNFTVTAAAPSGAVNTFSPSVQPAPPSP